MIKRVILSFFPLDTRRGRALKGVAAKLQLAHPPLYDHDFVFWTAHKEKDVFAMLRSNFPDDVSPRFSIVIPTYNTAEKYLQPLIYSLVNQTYDNWEVIITDGSPDEESAQLIEQYCKQDERIKYHHNNTKGISANTNHGLKFVKGKYIVFVDHDDILDLHALNELATVIDEEGAPDIIYSDEDKISDNGTLRHSPHFKPDWAPHQFLSCNYTNHISAVYRDWETDRKSVV